MNKRRQKKETRKVVDGVVRRAYGLFRKKVVSNVPWSVTALENIISGDYVNFSANLKYYNDINITESLSLVDDEEPARGETVEVRMERKITRVIQDKQEESGIKDTDTLLFSMGTTSKPPEWKSKHFEWPPPVKKRPTIIRVPIIEWIEADIVSVSHDRQYFSVRVQKGGKILHKVIRTRIRILGQPRRPLLGEIHFRLGSAQNAAEIPASRFFRSIRLADEQTDGQYLGNSYSSEATT